MLRLLAHIISYLFHPLLMPTYLYAAIAFFSPMVFQNAPWVSFILMAVFGLTAVVPALNVLMFKLTGTINNVHMPTRQERVTPFIFITILYIGITVLFYLKLPIPVVVKLMMLCAALVCLVCAATFFFKVSVHAVAMAGLTGILLALAAFSSAQTLMVPALIALVLTGVVMSSRLLLMAHTLQEVSWGGVLGFAIGFAGVIILF
jgi:hypothetical protein